MKRTFSTLSKLTLTQQILLAMVLGTLTGILFNFLKLPATVDAFLVDGVFKIGGKIFIVLMKMLVVPVVFVSLVSGAYHLGSSGKMGRLGAKTLALFIITTALAIVMGLSLATFFKVGGNAQLANNLTQTYTPPTPQPISDTIINIFPANPIAAMAEGEMLQIIIFAIFLGVAISLAKTPGQRIASVFQDLNDVVMQLMHMVFKLTPYGVFCLLAAMFARLGFSLIGELMRGQRLNAKAACQFKSTSLLQKNGTCHVIRLQYCK